MKIKKIKCSCGEYKSEGNYYICSGCNRLAPHCFGAADKYFDYCDDCAVELMKDDEEETRERMRTMINQSWLGSSSIG